MPIRRPWGSWNVAAYGPTVIGMSPDASPSSVWPVLHYDDMRAALRFLVDVLGFAEVVAAPDEHGGIGHAELRWPGGGALVFGSPRHTDSVHGGCGLEPARSTW
ncbi:hypothetical protein Srufu_076670 [Streptomyces libani subsp. rufus]|nr:hypothetical protein Srufu_076670 [Streptomyces libani subsp. rufus]